MIKNLSWFRFYVEVLDDPKVQTLPGDLFKAWVNVLCVARKHGGVLPSLNDTAFGLRITAEDCCNVLGELHSRQLLDDNYGTLVPHNFAARQFESDVSTERVKRFRKRHRKPEQPVSETPPDTELRYRSEQTRASEWARARGC